MALLGVFVVGTTGYLIVEQDPRPSLGDAAYMTVITLSTVGFGEVWELSPRGKLWTIGVISFGIITVSYAFTSMIALFVGGELRSQREVRRMDKRLESLTGHVILCGYGRTGSMVVRELARYGLDSVVIESNREIEPELREAKLPYLIGDSTDENKLIEAGVMRATALVAALPHDADNVFITLTSHTLNPGLRIIARAEQPSTEAKLLCAGATRVICPQIIGARRMAALLARPNAVDFVESISEGVHLEMDEYRIDEDSSLCGRTLRESLVQDNSGGSVVAIKRADGEIMFNPYADTNLAAGDTLIVVGPTGLSTRLERMEKG